MYLPEHFTENDAHEIAQLIAQFPLATLVCYFEGEFIANHIPLFRTQKDIFIGHIAKANALHENFPNGTNAIAVFRAEDSYISPNLYPTKKETHRQVPTWNYQVVHLHGDIVFDYSTKSKLAVVGKLTKMYEGMYFSDNAWKMADAPKDYMAEMLDNIVAFTLKVKRISAKSKLNQNKEAVDFNAVAEAMRNSGKSVLSNSMKRFKRES